MIISLLSLWEEIESINIMPIVTTVVDDIAIFMTAIATHKAESHLFQFFNGLDDTYASSRTQLLMHHPLPTVGFAYATIQQEESQKDLFNIIKTEVSAMYGRSQIQYKGPACTARGQKNHSTDRCWTVLGYSRWHRKYKPHQGNSAPTQKRQQKSNQNHFSQPRQANNVVQTTDAANEEATFTTQQLQRLLRLLPQGSTANCQ